MSMRGVVPSKVVSRPRRQPTRSWYLALVLAGLGVVGGACSSESTEPSATTERSQSAPFPAPTAAPPTTADSTDSKGPRSLDEIDSEIAVAIFDGESVDQPAPYFGAQDASGAPSQPTAGFEPEPANQEFCWAVSVINHRPQPRDDFEEIVVAHHYFDAIEPYVVAELQDEFSVLMEFTASIVKNGSFTEADEVDDDSDVARALETINQFVDRECLGQP